MADITAKQKMFADEYILTGNATQAYMTVYKCKEDSARANATRMIANDSIKKYIEEVNKQFEPSKIADMAEVKQFWTELLRSKEVEPKDRLKASEYIAKTNGAFIDKVEAKSETVNKLDLSNITTDQLRELIKNERT